MLLIVEVPTVDHTGYIQKEAERFVQNELHKALQELPRWLRDKEYVVNVTAERLSQPFVQKNTVSWFARVQRFGDHEDGLQPSRPGGRLRMARGEATVVSPPSWPHTRRVPFRNLPKYASVPISGLVGPPRSHYAPFRPYGPGGKEMKRRTIKKWVTRWLYDRERSERRLRDSHLRNQPS